MQFETTPLDGAYVVSLEPRGDDRGFFARTWCEREFEELGLNTDVVQCNMSYNVHAGTLRGLHYQSDPAPETKLIRCVRGAVLDVIVDLREESDTYLQHFAIELTAENRLALFVPEYFAHGFQTLRDDTEVMYQVTAYYTPETEGGLRYDDPDLGIEWPLAVTTISDKDRHWPLVAKR